MKNFLRNGLLLCVCLVRLCLCADLVIRIPGDVSKQDGYYRLNYHPPEGFPPANTTFRPQEIADVIEFSRGLPGTKYDFWLYYSNASISDWLTWTASITTAPDPPANLSINIRSGKVAKVLWDPPKIGGHSTFKLKVIPLSEPQKSVRNLMFIEESPFHLRELSAGASYEIQLFTVYENKESAAYISTNFTTKPNTPGRFIVWFRNETTLLVLWQPPYPAGIYTHYKVSIDPTDAVESVLYVEKEGEPPGPAQAAFNGLVPGRAYNISVQTVSEDQISLPTTAQYRTVPLRPWNVTFNKNTVRPGSFEVRWNAPKGKSEFARYQVSIGIRKKTPIIVERGQPLQVTFTENLEPGKTYEVVVKTVSGNVASWPTKGNVTTRPLSVLDLNATTNETTGEIMINWKPNPESHQDAYKVTYQEVETFNGDSSSQLVESPQFSMNSLLPGRNYSITVQAVSNNVQSKEVTVFQATRPASPIIEDLQPIPYGLNISWKSDVTSTQEEYAVVYTRNDTGEAVTQRIAEPRVLLVDLYPGAGYEIKVFAISHDLWSEPHAYFQAVFPNPIRNLTITEVTNTSIFLKWLPPLDSIFTNYLVRYRTVESQEWMKLISILDTKTELKDLIPGERFVIEVNAVSHKVESSQPQRVMKTIRPNPVRNVSPILVSTNVTLEWPRPEGRIEMYTVTWYPDENSRDRKSKEIPGNKATEGINRKLSVLIGDLIPGVSYTFEIITTAHSVSSDVVTVKRRTMPLIRSEITIVNNQHISDAITLRYTLTPASISRFDTYRFMLSDPSIPIKEKSATDEDRKITFSELVPGRLYNITVWTVSGGVTSQPLQRRDRLYPQSITMINSTKITDTEITLTWDRPNGDYDAFEVQYLDEQDHLIQNLTLPDSITISNLRPHRNYTFTVIVRSGTASSVLRRSLPVSAIFTTRESVPGKVSNFVPVDIQPSKIVFDWSLPSIAQNGILTGFTITYGLKGSTYTSTRDFSPYELRGEITGLFPGKIYTFRIQAKTKVGYGSWQKWEQLMPIWAPPKPSRQVFPTEVSRTSTTIRIRFRKNYFSNQNGQVIAYAIIVSEDDSKDSSGLEMPSWRDVQSYSLWPPYQVNDPYYPFNNKSVEDITVGTATCEKMLGYCNGPLKPGSTYRVKIRAFTARDKFVDTYYSLRIQTDPDNTAIIVGVTIPIILLFLVGVILISWRKRRLGACVKKAADSRGNDNLSIPESVIETSRPVKLKDFAEHYRRMAADSDFRFSEEYEELKHIGRDQHCTAADFPVNRPKNRFTNILPYDHSRVKLQPSDDEEGSDYINANYVPGFNSPREFIVTQGPLHSTRDDFWRMCWESNSRAIVMLTRCIEKGREKCDHYWPYDTQPVYYGDIQVTILNESHFQDWNISEFRMCWGDTSRIIRHFHFTTWPDFGVPDPPQTLVRFVRAFRERVGPDQRPLVVHCSAGVGRSGTFIALDRILQNMKKSEYVDIFGIVYEMRKERVWMVQTEQQYICIHQCLLAVLEGKENEGSAREVHENEGFEDDEGIAESGM